MPFVGTGHLWLIGILLIIVLIVWGPGKLPDVGSGLGRAIQEFRRASAQTKDEFSRATRPEAPASAAVPITTPQMIQPEPSVVAEPTAFGGDPRLGT